MTDEKKMEKLSILMDGELTNPEIDQTINQITDDPETLESWQRYHLIGDTMRSTVPGLVDPELASKISAMIDKEPTVLAPKPKKIEYLKPLAGLAVAASVAAVAVLGVQRMEQDPSLDALSTVAAIQTEAASSQALAGSNVISLKPSVSTVKYEAPGAAKNTQQMNKYILNHNQYNSRPGIQGVSPYARLVGHDANQ